MAVILYTRFFETTGVDEIRLTVAGGLNSRFKIFLVLNGQNKGRSWEMLPPVGHDGL